MVRPKTIFIDIDGTILHHYGDLSQQITKIPIVLDGVKEKFIEWDKKGYIIILTTGRKEALRKITEKQIVDVGLFFDQLIMGCGGGERILINDMKVDSDVFTASVYCPKRNNGIKMLDI
jgi:histidinol phosphatase-like enzyme